MLVGTLITERAMTLEECLAYGPVSIKRESIFSIQEVRETEVVRRTHCWLNQMVHHAWSL